MAQAELGPISDRTGINDQITQLMGRVENLQLGQREGFDIAQARQYIREMIENTMTLSEMRVASSRCYSRLRSAQWNFFRVRSLRLLGNLVAIFQGQDGEAQTPFETELDERIIVISRLIDILTDCKEKYQGSRIY